MESHNSASDAAAMVAIKREYNADTDDEAVLSAPRNNNALGVASMVAVKKEYEADTDDEAASSAADMNKSMVPVKKEYNADTDSDVSEAASIVAVKIEIEADTDDEAVATSNAASMVAVKAEYNADTDDEEAAADKNSASGVAAMAAVKTEYDADTDSDEEQQQQPNKKAKRDDEEHEKYIAEIRKITDPLISLGQHDGAQLELVYRIADDLESFSNELWKCANNMREYLEETEQDFNEHEKYLAKIREIANQLLSLGRSHGNGLILKSCPWLKQIYRIETDLKSFTCELKAFLKVEKEASDVVASMKTDKKGKRQQPTKKAKPYRDEHKQHIAEIRRSTDRLLSLGRRDGDKLKQVNQIAHDLESLVKDAALNQFERKNVLKVWVRDSDNPNAQKHLAYLSSGSNGAGDGNYVWIRWDSNIYKRVRVKKSRVENLEGESYADMLEALKNGAGVEKEYDADADSDEQIQQPGKRAKQYEAYLAKIREITDQLLTSSQRITIRHPIHRIANDLEWFSNELKESVEKTERERQQQNEKAKPYRNEHEKHIACELKETANDIAEKQSPLNVEKEASDVVASMKTDKMGKRQQPTKKAKPYRDEHKQHIAEIRYFTDRLLSLGRCDGDKLKQVNRIAHDLESLSSELRNSVKDAVLDRFERKNVLKVWVRDSDFPNAQKHLAYLCTGNGADNGNRVWIRWDSDIGKRVTVKKSRVENLVGASCADMLEALKNGEGVIKEYDADADSDEKKEQPVKKATLDDSSEYEKSLAKIREITDQLLSSSKLFTSKNPIYRVADDLEGFSNVLKGSVKDVEREIEEEEQKLREQRVREESWEQFQRKNGLMVWARDSDNPNAQQHLAYLCSCYGGPDDGDHVWIRWDSFIGKRVRVSKSRIEDLEGAYSKIYAWCNDLGRLFMLPYDRFLYWRKLLECKTWGDMKAISNDEDIEKFKDRYKRRWNPDKDLEEEDEKHINNLKDDTVIDFGDEGDFDLCDYNDILDTFVEKFPPPIERLMYDEINVEEANLHPHCDYSMDCYCIAIEEQEAVFDELEKLEAVTMLYCPQLRDLFVSYEDF